MWLYGLAHRPPARPDLLLPHSRRVRTRGLTVRRSRHVRADDRTIVDGIVVLTPAFLIISLGAHVEPDTLLSVAVDARQRRLLEIDVALARLAEMPRVPGRATVERVLRRLLTDGSDSMLESEVRGRLLAEGLRPSREPVPVALPTGRTVHLDVAFPAARVAIECQGFLAHSSRRQLDRDARRANALALHGEWTVLQLAWDRYTGDWQGFLHELRTALRARGAA